RQLYGRDDRLRFILRSLRVVADSRRPQRVMQEPAESGAAAADESAVQRDVGKAAHECAERQVTVRLATQVETLRIDKLRGIAVAGADADMDIGSRRHGDAAKRRVLGGAAVAELVGAFQAQEL